jgi:hypothetical protein
MQVRIQGFSTLQNGIANEDIAGAVGRYAWIVDGASGVGTERLTSGVTDAAWLAGAIDHAIRERASREDAPALDGLVLLLEQDLKERFARETQNVPDGERDAPSACLALVEFSPATDGTVHVRAAIAGDVSVFVPASSGLARWTDERLKPFETRTLGALGALLRETVDVPDHVLVQIRENRLWLNREGGYFAVHPGSAWASWMLRFEAKVRPGTGVMLATDGFLRLSDLFGHATDEDLYAAVLAGEASSLMKILRDLERNDPLGHRHLRVKTHDDATVMAVAMDLSETRSDPN